MSEQAYAVCATSADELADDSVAVTQTARVPIVHVPCSSVLLDRWEEMGDFRAAFVSWGTDFLEGFDKAHAERRLPWQQDIDMDPYYKAVQQWNRGERTDPVNLVLREALLPHWVVGVRMADLAARADISLRLTVCALIGNAAAKNIEAYVAAEEMVLSGESGLTVAGVARACGIGSTAARTLFRVHNVERASARYANQAGKSETREYIEKLMEFGVPAKDVLQQVESERPDLDTSGITLNALYNWRRGMARHGRL